MKGITFFLALLMTVSLFLVACDTDNSKSYNFNGTVEIVQYPVGATLSLEELAKPQYNSKIRFEAIVKNASGEIVTNAMVSWGTKNVSSDNITLSTFNKMAINVSDSDYMPENIIEVQASYGGVLSSIATITFAE